MIQDYCCQNKKLTLVNKQATKLAVDDPTQVIESAALSSEGVGIQVCICFVFISANSEPYVAVSTVACFLEY